ncbi:MAG: amino acid adenylation domain-containing protein [Lachnospiraceae bacterium]
MELTVLDWLDRTADRIPDKTAFIDEGGSISFYELRKKAQEVGSSLLPYKVFGKPVIVMSGRHILTPACFLGVVYSGGFYAPVDASMPKARLMQILQVIQSEVMIVDRENLPLAQELDFSGKILVMEELAERNGMDAEKLAAIRKKMSSDMPLYTIFTSGSTGIPKGVITSHYSLMCYIDAVAEVLDIGEEDRMGNQSPLDYIAAVRDIYFPVLRGATTVILPKRYFAVPATLFEALNAYQVTTLCWSTSALTIPAQMKAFEYEEPKYLKKVCFSGSVMPGKILKIWQEHLPGALFVNQYGPTEATASCTYYIVKEKVTEDTVLPIGKPYRQYRILLLDEDGKETPEGEIGEICVLGPILALGYYNAPEKSMESFVQNPLNTSYRELMYKTGDLGRIRPDGELEFHGRRDRQIKHLGHRVELGDLEKAAGDIAGVEECCALYHKEKEHLYLFYTGEKDKKELYIELRQKLPGFMVPRKIIPLEEIPRLPNGKTDMNTLKSFFGH